MLSTVFAPPLTAASFAIANWLGIGAKGESAARIIMFHGTPRRDAAALERQLRWLKRRFQLVPLRAIIAAAINGNVGRKLAITFDDGLRSNFTVAYPLLHRLAIPATFFICPGLVDRASWLWTHETRRRLARLEFAARQEFAREWDAPAGVEPFVEWMKTLASAARRGVEARLREATPGFAPSAEEREDFDLATWEDLRRIDPAIVTIGSHSLTHTILPTAAPAELESEVRDSRRLLERGLQRPVDLFAYPNGATDAAVESCVGRHYRAAVIASRGAIRRGTDTLALPRLAAPRGVLRLARRISP